MHRRFGKNLRVSIKGKQLAKSSENGFHFPKIEKGGTNLLGGAVEGFDALFFSEALARGALENVLWIVRSNLRRDFLMRAVKFFSPSLNVVEIPAWDCLPYDRLSPDSQTAASTASALANLSGRTPSLIILPVQMALRKVPAPSVMRDAQLLLRKGQEIRIETIRDFLERWGYRRADVVSLPGDYALRGGLLDVYPPRGDALRLDMFGETLEKIAPFDTESQIREKGGERAGSASLAGQRDRRLERDGAILSHALESPFWKGCRKRSSLHGDGGMRAPFGSGTLSSPFS